MLEYVKYTNRHALVQEFVPSADEQRLYDGVSTYLQRPTLYALPASQRQLVTLILRKLLASSSYAIAGTLDSMVRRLEAAAAATDLVDTLPDDLPDHWEDIDEMAEEWEEENDTASSPHGARLTPEQLAELQHEMADSRAFLTLARSLVKNSKGEVLLRRFLEKIFPSGTPTDYTLAFLTSNPFVRCSGVYACPKPAGSPVPYARTESRYTLSCFENDRGHTALL